MMPYGHYPHTKGNMRRCPDLGQQDVSSILYGCGAEGGEGAAAQGKESMQMVMAPCTYVNCEDLPCVSGDGHGHGIDTW